MLNSATRASLSAWHIFAELLASEHDYFERRQGSGRSLPCCWNQGHGSRETSSTASC